MNWYEKHLGDWAKKTGHLSMLEEGAYNRLCDWCYIHERPLPLLMADIYKIGRARHPAERAAIARCVGEFFTLAPDGYHQGRIDKVLAEYAKRISRNTNNPDSPAERARRSREKRARLFKTAATIGLNAPWNATNKELEQLLISAGVDGQKLRDVLAPVDVTVTGTVTDSQQPPTNSRDVADFAATTVTPAGAAGFAAAARDAADAAGVIDPTLTGRAVKQIKAGGFNPVSINSADPRFLLLVQQGVTDDEWRLTAAEAAARGKGWGFLLATIAGRREDVRNGFAVLRPGMAPKRDERERVAGLTPTIAAKRGNAL